MTISVGLLLCLTLLGLRFPVVVECHFPSLVSAGLTNEPPPPQHNNELKLDNLHDSINQIAEEYQHLMQFRRVVEPQPPTPPPPSFPNPRHKPPPDKIPSPPKWNSAVIYEDNSMEISGKDGESLLLFRTNAIAPNYISENALSRGKIGLNCESIGVMRRKKDSVSCAGGRREPNESLNGYYGGGDAGSRNESDMERERGVEELDNIQLSISPNRLDFQNSSLCIPSILQFEIKNIYNEDDSAENEEEEELQIYEIIFQDKEFLSGSLLYLEYPVLLKPGGSKKVEVIFLPKKIGFVESKLVIRTSKGDVNYILRGIGVPNEYGLKGVQSTIAIGDRYDPGILITNSFNQVLRIKEVYSTEGFLHISLPKQTNNEKNAVGMWEVEPKSTREIFKLSFMSLMPGQFNGYVHMKTNHDNLIIPFEITVANGGLSINPNFIDFGLLTAEDESHEISVDLSNTGKDAVNIIGLTLSNPDPHLTMLLRVSPVIPGGTTAKNGLVLIYHGLVEGIVQGRIKIETNNTHLHGNNMGFDPVTIDFRANVRHGTITYPRDHVAFNLHSLRKTYSDFANADGDLIFPLDLTNRFNSLLSLEKVYVMPSSYFQNYTEISVFNFTPNAVAKKNQKWPRILLKVKPFDFEGIFAHARSKRKKKKGTGGRLRTLMLHVSTNATFHTIPLHLHYGLLNINGTSGTRSNLKSIKNRCNKEKTRCLYQQYRKNKKQDNQKSKCVWEKVPSLSFSSSSNSRPNFIPCYNYDLDFGRIAVTNERTKVINISNYNPVPIGIKKIFNGLSILKYSLEDIVVSPAASLPVAQLAKAWHEMYPNYRYKVRDIAEKIIRFQLKLDSVRKQRIRAQNFEKESEEMVTLQSESDNFLFEIPPGHVAILKLRLHPVHETPRRESDMTKEELEMPQQEKERGYFSVLSSFTLYQFHARYEATYGDVFAIAPQIDFQPTFPGKIEMLPLYLYNSFNHDVHVDSVQISDRRGQLIIVNPILKPNQNTVIGSLVLSPAYSLACQDVKDWANCLFPSSSPPVLSDYGFDITTSDIDASSTRMERLAEMRRLKQNRLEMKIIANTDVGIMIPLTASVKLTLPRFYQTKLIPLNNPHGRKTKIRIRKKKKKPVAELKFPLTQVNQMSKLWLPIFNPSNVTVLIGLALSEEDRHHNQTFFHCQKSYILSSERNGKIDEDDAECCQQWQQLLSESPAVSQWYIPTSAWRYKRLVPGQSSVIGPIYYSPFAINKEEQRVIYLRNNITHFDTILLRGIGGRGILEVSTLNKDSKQNVVSTRIRPLSTNTSKVVEGYDDNSIRFEMVLMKKSSSKITQVQKSIKLENKGNLALQIINIHISGQPCRRAGFRLLVPECKNMRRVKQIQFELKPNRTRFIDIGYKSDCIFYKEKEILRIETTGGMVSFDLTAHLHPTALNYAYCLNRHVAIFPKSSILVEFWSTFVLTIAILLLFFSVFVVAKNVLENHSRSSTFNSWRNEHSSSTNILSGALISTTCADPVQKDDAKDFDWDEEKISQEVSMLPKQLQDQLLSIEKKSFFSVKNFQSPSAQRLLSRRLLIEQGEKNKKKKIQKEHAPTTTTPAPGDSVTSVNSTITAITNKSASKIQKPVISPSVQRIKKSRSNNSGEATANSLSSSTKLSVGLEKTLKKAKSVESAPCIIRKKTEICSIKARGNGEVKKTNNDKAASNGINPNIATISKSGGSSKKKQQVAVNSNCKINCKVETSATDHPEKALNNLKNKNKNILQVVINNPVVSSSRTLTTPRTKISSTIGKKKLSPSSDESPSVPSTSPSFTSPKYRPVPHGYSSPKLTTAVDSRNEDDVPFDKSRPSKIHEKTVSTPYSSTKATSRNTCGTSSLLSSSHVAEQKKSTWELNCIQTDVSANATPSSSYHLSGDIQAIGNLEYLQSPLSSNRAAKFDEKTDMAVVENKPIKPRSSPPGFAPLVNSPKRDEKGYGALNTAYFEAKDDRHSNGFGNSFDDESSNLSSSQQQSFVASDMRVGHIFRPSSSKKKPSDIGEKGPRKKSFGNGLFSFANSSSSLFGGSSIFGGLSMNGSSSVPSSDSNNSFEFPEDLNTINNDISAANDEPRHPGVIGSQRTMGDVSTLCSDMKAFSNMDNHHNSNLFGKSSNLFTSPNYSTNFGNCVVEDNTVLSSMLDSSADENLNQLPTWHHFPLSSLNSFSDFDKEKSNGPEVRNQLLGKGSFFNSEDREH